MKINSSVLFGREEGQLVLCSLILTTVRLVVKVSFIEVSFILTYLLQNWHAL